MPFVKGQSGNPAGRPKGNPNKIDAATRAIFMNVMTAQIDHIENALQDLRQESSEKYIAALGKLLPYFLPKQEHTEITFKGPHKAPSWFKDLPVNDAAQDVL